MDRLFCSSQLYDLAWVAVNAHMSSSVVSPAARAAFHRRYSAKYRSKKTRCFPNAAFLNFYAADLVRGMVPHVDATASHDGNTDPSQVVVASVVGLLAFADDTPHTGLRVHGPGTSTGVPVLLRVGEMVAFSAGVEHSVPCTKRTCDRISFVFFY